MTSIAQSKTGVFSISKPWRIVIIGVVVGAVLATIWSFNLVDSVIGDTVANNLLGYNAKTTAIDSTVMGTLFAFVVGLAGTFTACNICAFSAIAPLAADKASGSAIKPLLWLALGTVTVSALYGAVGVLLGPTIPQLSTARLGDPQTGFPVRLLQSSVVFVIIGLIFVVWALVTLGILRNPVNIRFSWVRSFFIGALIGAFQIGRPYGLFFKMFQYAVSTHDVLFGALSFLLSGLGNILAMSILFLLLYYGTGGRFQKWLSAKPGRLIRLTAYTLLIGGVFFIVYWGLRVPSSFGIGWWPKMPWN